MCLPQKPFASEELKVRFTKSLVGIDRFYSHPYTLVVIVDTNLPTGASYSNTRPHFKRGW